MKTLLRNKQSFYYALYDGMTESVDEDGFLTGEHVPCYTDPRPIAASMSEPSGYTTVMQFGMDIAYDRLLVFDKDPGFDEQSVFWIDKLPEIDDVGKTETPPDYYVVRVARSLNVVSVFVRKRVTGNPTDRVSGEVVGD